MLRADEKGLSPGPSSSELIFDKLVGQKSSKNKEGHTPPFQSERVAPVAKPKNYNQTVACVCILGRGVTVQIFVIQNGRVESSTLTPLAQAAGCQSMRRSAERFLPNLGMGLRHRCAAPAPLFVFH